MPINDSILIVLVDIPDTDYSKIHWFSQHMAVIPNGNGDIDIWEGEDICETIGLDIKPGSIVYIHIFEYDVASFMASKGRNFTIWRDDDGGIDFQQSDIGHLRARFLRLERERLAITNTPSHLTGHIEPKSVDSEYNHKQIMPREVGIVIFVLQFMVHTIVAYYIGQFLVNCDCRFL
ncbi:hypothetical protein DXG01_007032 [Tephrocybe rancida]|nr:hypothetical protein DXG01_007032 [Tephrocybe rancida]